MLKKSLARVLFSLYSVLVFFTPFREVSILVYHSVSDTPIDTAVSALQFREQLSQLKAAGYTFISLDDVIAWLDGGEIPHKAVALTFDDGYADFEDTALPILDEFNAPVTVFVMGDEIAARSALGNALPLLDADALARVRAQPRINIGYHARTHADLRTLSGGALKDEVRPPFTARYFAYPGGNYSVEAVDAVRAAGYEAAFSIKPTQVRRSSNRFLMPRFVIAKTGPMRDVRFYASPAAAWYRALTRLV